MPLTKQEVQALLASRKGAKGTGRLVPTQRSGVTNIIPGGRYPGGAPQGVGKSVSKGGNKFALVGALTGGGGLGTAVAIHDKDKDNSRDLAAATIGGWGGQGAYQGAGYAAKWRAQNKHEPKTSKNQRNKILKPVKAKHGAYTPAMERNFPKELPEYRTHRALGWTHRGRTGTALGAIATAAGTYGGVKMIQPKQKVRKGDFGYERSHISKPRAAEALVGAAALGWGGSRLGIVRGTLAMGSRKAGNLGIVSRHAEKIRNTVEVSTGRGAAMLGSQVNTGFRLRPIEGTVGGALLINHALPVRRKEFTPVRAPLQQGGY